MKKFLTIMMALVLVFSLTITAFAAAEREKVTGESNKVGVTLQDANGYTNTFAGHTYKAVKILDLYRMKDGSSYLTDSSGNPVYQYDIASGITRASFLSALSSAGFSFDTTTGEIQKSGAAISSYTANDGASTDATRLASAIAQYVESNNIAGTTLSTSGATRLEPGYWVIYETSNGTNPDDGEVATKPILVDLRLEDVSEGKILALKDAQVELTKDVTVDEGETNEGSGETTPGGQGSVFTYDINTNFPIYGVMPSTRTVSFIITDVMPTGLDIDESSVAVKVGGVAVTAGSNTYTKNYNSSTRTLTITFNSACILDHPGQAVEVTYTAIANQSAVYNNAAGNPNTASVTFSNNPVVSSEIETLTDDAIVYLYAFELDKLDGAGAALAGATFQVHAGAANGPLVKFISGTNGYYADLNVDLEDGAAITATGVTTITVPATGVKFYGMPAGDYYFEELTSPNGYTKLANPVHVKVEEVLSGGELTGACKIAVENGLVDTSATGTSGSGNATSGTDGSLLHVKVQNYKGVTLPATGSTLSLILMIAGGVVVLGGIVAFILISRKKKDDDEEEVAA